MSECTFACADAKEFVDESVVFAWFQEDAVPKRSGTIEVRRSTAGQRDETWGRSGNVVAIGHCL